MELDNMEENNRTHNYLECTDGAFLPAWLPLEDISTGQIVAVVSFTS